MNRAENHSSIMLKCEAQEMGNTRPFLAPSLFSTHLKTFEYNHDLLRKVKRLGKTKASKILIKLGQNIHK